MFHPSIGIAKAIAVVAYYSTASSFVEPKQLRSHRTNIHQTWYRRGTDKASLSQKFVDRIQFRSRSNRFARNLPCSIRVKYCSFNFYRNSENDYANLVYHVCDSIQCLKIPFFFHDKMKKTFIQIKWMNNFYVSFICFRCLNEKVFKLLLEVIHSRLKLSHILRSKFKSSYQSSFPHKGRGRDISNNIFFFQAGFNGLPLFYSRNNQCFPCAHVKTLLIFKARDNPFTRRRRPSSGWGCNIQMLLEWIFSSKANAST